MTIRTVMSVRTGLVEHLIADMLIKAAIVGVSVVIVIVAMVILWKTVGRGR
ncbi:hypothetical protein [Paramicrobacterium agarici]|uniref:Uncharacterized protein n=1 Tax=Paramicrobacterium agarici TaxID=630514 RepID=A0A2A9DSE1_9MICO|nr:hypothetical protein [Microbacterium agarici]PFG29503.1 hypothetical protein ATJ78_0409 [Microbacterium agarici]TQO22508.1 hypothetical protein FB385_1339 [Microbacterium agarici]